MNPTTGLHHLQLPDLLQVVEVVPDSDGDFAGSVALVGFVIGVNTQHLHRGPPPELYVDEVRLGSVRLPVRLQIIVSELVHSKTWFT